VPATRIFYDKAIYPDDGAIVEMTIWEVPEPVPEGFAFLRLPPGRRVVIYDNERGKGESPNGLTNKTSPTYTSNRCWKPYLPSGWRYLRPCAGLPIHP